MSETRRRIPIHCLHKPSGKGYVRLDGRMLYTDAWGTDEAGEAYDRIVAEWVQNGRRLPEKPLGPAYTVEDLIGDYWVHAHGYYRKDGEVTNEVYNIRLALRPLRKFYGELPVTDFGPKKLKAVRQHMIDADLSRRLINQRISIIKRTFAWGVEEEKVPGEVMHALRCVAGLRYGRSGARETDPVEPVAEGVFKATLPHLGMVVRAAAELQWWTGMRPGEALTIRMADLDRTGKVWLYAPRRHKTQHHGRTRTVALGPKAQEVLQPFFSLDPEAYLFRPAHADEIFRQVKRVERKSRVTPSQRARQQQAARGKKRRFAPHYSVNSYRQAIQRACDEAEVPRWSPNQLRHAAATRIRKEYGLEVARTVLGHSSSAVTEIYAELDLNQAVRAMERSG